VSAHLTVESAEHSHYLITIFWTTLTHLLSFFLIMWTGRDSTLHNSCLYRYFIWWKSCTTIPTTVGRRVKHLRNCALEHTEIARNASLRFVRVVYSIDIIRMNQARSLKRKVYLSLQSMCATRKTGLTSWWKNRKRKSGRSNLEIDSVSWNEVKITKWANLLEYW